MDKVEPKAHKISPNSGCHRGYGNGCDLHTRIYRSHRGRYGDGPNEDRTTWSN